MSDKLQPCPFCGDVNPSMQGQTDRTLSYEPSAWVECETCGAQSRGFCRTSEAMEAWNRRATSPARDNEGGLRASTPDGIDLAAQIAHQQEIYCGDCATFGEQSKWSIKSGSILASLIELQDARAHLSAHPVTWEGDLPAKHVIENLRWQVANQCSFSVPVMLDTLDAFIARIPAAPTPAASGMDEGE